LAHRNQGVEGFTHMPDYFSMIRTVLISLGLSAEAIDDIIERIKDFLFEKDRKTSQGLNYPYFVRDDFLSPAEQILYLALKDSVSDQALIFSKVSLGDLFFVKSNDPSEFRVYINKIDRKHVDFLLCDLKTVRPLAGVELDDKSRSRDKFLRQVFEAARLPLVRVPVKQAYAADELRSLFLPYLGGTTAAAPASEPVSMPASVPVVIETEKSTLKCPVCGSSMVLRTAETGNNPGEKFWGCSRFPKCRGILKYSAMDGIG
jgi:hypothetical protein